MIVPKDSAHFSYFKKWFEQCGEECKFTDDGDIIIPDQGFMEDTDSEDESTVYSDDDEYASELSSEELGLEDTTEDPPKRLKLKRA